MVDSKAAPIRSIAAKVGEGFGDEPLKRVAMGLLLAFPLALLAARSVADVIVVLIGLAFLFESIRRRRWGEWLRDPVILAALALWAVLNLVVSPMAVDSAVSFERSLPWIRFLLFYAAITVWLLADHRSVRLVMWWMACVVALVVIDCLIQALSGLSVTGQPIQGIRLTGLLDRPNIGSFLAKTGFPLVGLLLCVYCFGSSLRRSLVISTLGLVIFLSILLTGERTITLLTLLSLALVLFFVFISATGRRLLVACLSVLPVGVIAAVIMLEGRIHQRLSDLVADLSHFWESPYGHLFSAAWRIFMDNPLTGVGLKNFREVCTRYTEHCHPHPHNIYLEFLSESGVFGFVFFLAFVATIIVTFARRTIRNSINPAAAGFFTGALLISLFPFAATQSYFSNWPAMLLWYSLSLAMAAVRIPWRNGGSESGSSISESARRL